MVSQDSQSISPLSVRAYGIGQIVMGTVLHPCLIAIALHNGRRLESCLGLIIGAIAFTFIGSLYVLWDPRRVRRVPWSSSIGGWDRLFDRTHGVVVGSVFAGVAASVSGWISGHAPWQWWFNLLPLMIAMLLLISNAFMKRCAQQDRLG